MNEEQKMIRDAMDAWHQKVLDEQLEMVAGVIAKLPLKETAPEMRLAAVEAVKLLIDRKSVV